MNTKQYLIICLATTLIGMFLCAMHYEFIIIKQPLIGAHTPQQAPSAGKKEVTLFFWQHNKWQSEKHALLWTNALEHDLKHLLNALLSVWEDERLISKKVRVESVALSQSQHDAYISFDRNPLPEAATIFKKWHLIESVLKTMRDNHIPIQRVQFLLYHEPLPDYHLDFNHAWPVHGFAQ